MVRPLGDLMKNLFIHQESAEQEDKYLPPNDEALTYIRSMPVYQEYSYPLDSLPEAGSYRLPVEFCAKHWLSLDNYFRSHLSSKRLYRYSADFFKQIPGIKEVHFEEISIIPDPNVERSIGGRSQMIVYLNEHEEKFSVENHLVFENSIAGAITSLVISTTINQYISYWHALYGCDHAFIPSEKDIRDVSPDQTKSLKFPNAFSKTVPIPWGFRIEIIEAEHYLVRALAQSPTSGLLDVTTEIENGIVVQNSKILLQERLERMMF